MTQNILERPPPKKFSWRLWLAIALELAIFLCMVSQTPNRGAVLGIALMVIYFYFSALRAALFDLLSDD